VFQRLRLIPRATVIGYDDGNHTSSYPPDVARSLRTWPVMQTSILESGTERSTSYGKGVAVATSLYFTPLALHLRSRFGPGPYPNSQARPHKERRSGQRGNRFQVFSELRAHRPPS